MTFLNLGMCRFKRVPCSRGKDKAMTDRYLGGMTFLILGTYSFKPTPRGKRDKCKKGWGMTFLLLSIRRFKYRPL